MKDPEEERKSANVWELRIWNQATGRKRRSSPIRQKRKRRGASDRTGLRKGSELDRRYRPGASILSRWFSKEDSRCRGVKGRAEIRASSGELAGHFPSTDPCWSKTNTGSRGKISRFSRMPCSGRACRLESERFKGSFGTISVFSASNRNHRRFGSLLRK